MIKWFKVKMNPLHKKGVFFLFIQHEKKKNIWDLMNLFKRLMYFRRKLLNTSRAAIMADIF